MTPTAAVRSILGDYVSEARCREVVVAVLGACREPSASVIQAFYDVDPYERVLPSEGFPAMIDALIEEVTAEAGR